MEAVWSHQGSLSVGDVHDRMPSSSPVAYTTVKTTMERLADKDILTRAKEGKAYLYSAAVTRAELERRIVSNVLDGLVTEFPEAVASFFAQPGAQLSPTQLALLTEAAERCKDEGDV